MLCGKPAGAGLAQGSAAVTVASAPDILDSTRETTVDGPHDTADRGVRDRSRTGQSGVGSRRLKSAEVKLTG